MFKHILVPTDGSPLGNNAIAPAVAMAKAFSAKLTAITVSTPFHIVSADPLMISDTEDQYKKDSEKRASGYLAIVKEAAQGAGVPFAGVHVYEDHPYEAIIGAAARERCDVIAMASHGRKGAGALLLGSETTKVLTHSKIPVLVVR